MSSHRLLGLVIVLVLTGCAPQVAEPSGAAPVSRTPASTTPAPSASAASPDGSPTTAGVLLRGTGVSGHSFGADAVTVQDDLRQALGAENDTATNTGCASSPRATTTLRWSGLSVSFTAEGAEPLVLANWEVRPSWGVPDGVRLENDLPFTGDLRVLTDTHPGATLEEAYGWQVVTLPNGITYLGESRDAVFAVYGGPLEWCD